MRYSQVTHGQTDSEVLVIVAKARTLALNRYVRVSVRDIFLIFQGKFYDCLSLHHNDCLSLFINNILIISGVFNTKKSK